MGYSPWGHKESDTTERLSPAQHSNVYIGGKTDVLFWWPKTLNHREVIAQHDTGNNNDGD